MYFIQKLEKKLRWIAIPNLTYYLIAGQVIAFFLMNAVPAYEDMFSLRGAELLQGEWWRAVTFLFEPVTMNVFFLAFALYIYSLYGSALERVWGSFRYTLYFLISYVGTLALAFVFPQVSLSNGYLFTSLFLAFAFRFPEFQLMLFFIIPVKIKWLALIAWIGIGASVLFGTLPTKLLTLVSVLNFFIFFGSELWDIVQRKTKKESTIVQKYVIKEVPQHVCAVCNKNEKDNPTMGIRYCSKCTPSTCYCEEHIHDHEHKILISNK